MKWGGEMDIGYVWDEHKFQEVTHAHGVTFGEVVDVFEGTRTLYEEDPQGNLARLMAIGETRSGRVLQVVFTDEDAPLIRLITAFDASKEWKHEFRR